MSGHLGERLMSERVSIVDDALAEFAMGLTFDYEGQPSRRVEIIERGVAASPVTDSYWAAKTGRANTGPRAARPQRLWADARSTWLWTPARRRWTT